MEYKIIGLIVGAVVICIFLLKALTKDFVE